MKLCGMFAELDCLHTINTLVEDQAFKTHHLETNENTAPAFAEPQFRHGVQVGSEHTDKQKHASMGLGFASATFASSIMRRSPRRMRAEFVAREID